MHQYLELVQEVLEKGQKVNDRTGVGTLSLFARTLTFDLAEGFPLLTTKKMFWRGVVEELLWFISGSPDVSKLQEKGIKIWDANMESRGAIGPIYGFQWRHFGAKYVDDKTDYSGQGVDQLQGVIDELKRNPASRRLVISAWNPLDIPQMCLPPCHVLTQFYTRASHDGDNAIPKLDLMFYQRSADIGLGLPFNIASYALLNMIVAAVCGLQPGTLTCVLGDAHVYLNHVDGLNEQLGREPRPLPKVTINLPDGATIDDVRAEHIELSGYDPHPAIKLDMAV